MSTPSASERAASKRPLDDGDYTAAIATRKAPRCDTGGGFDSHLANLRASLLALSGMALDDAQLDDLAEVRDRLNKLISDKEEALVEHPDEVVLPKDELCQVFTFLPSAELAAAAQACCHFDAVVQEVAEQRIKAMFDGAFSLTFETRDLSGGRYTSRLLRVLEHEMSRSTALLELLNDSMKDKGCRPSDSAEDIIDELKTFHSAVLNAKAPLLIDKIRSLAASPKRKKLRELRSELWCLVQNSFDRITSHNSDERKTALQASVADVLAPELSYGPRCDNENFGAWEVLQSMPAAYIEAHAAYIFEHLGRAERSCLEHQALRVLGSLPVDVLVRIGARAHLAAYVETCESREDKKTAKRIMASLAQ